MIVIFEVGQIGGTQAYNVSREKSKTIPSCLPVTTYEKVKSDQNDLEGEQSDAHGDQSPCDAVESGLLVVSCLQLLQARYHKK
eukprot:scaffold12928_cov106-Skeletonema_marinoi.AAC.2